MTTLVDVDTGVVLDVVDGLGCADVKAWLTARSAAWRDGVRVVAIDPTQEIGAAWGIKGREASDTESF